GVRRRAERGEQAVERLSRALGGPEMPRRFEERELPVEDVDGLVEERPERLGAAVTHQRIRVLARWERDHEGMDAGGQERVGGAERGAEAGLVAVVEEEGVLGIAREDLRLLEGERGPESRDDVLDPARGERDVVHVPFDEERAALAANGALRPGQAVAVVARVVEWRRGRGAILGRALAVRGQPAAE